MMSVFGAFVLGDDVNGKMFGIGLSVAVFLDATLVRMVLVPATMSLVGRANWWLPSWLDRILPHLDLEGAQHRSRVTSSRASPSASSSPPERVRTRPAFTLHAKEPPMAMSTHLSRPARLHRRAPNRTVAALVQWLLAIPHLAIASVLSSLRHLLTAISLVTVLFTKRIPRQVFDTIAMTYRYEWRSVSYAFFLHDRYPPFDFQPAADDDGETPHTTVTFTYPDEMSRWKPLYKWLLAVPALRRVARAGPRLDLRGPVRARAPSSSPAPIPCGLATSSSASTATGCESRRTSGC